MKPFFTLLMFVFMLSFSANAQSEDVEITIAQKVKVFPNPATNVVNVLGLKNSDRADISISDTYGNVVIKHHWQIKNKALNIPITSLTSGIYVITIHSEEQRVQAKFYKK